MNKLLFCMVLFYVITNSVYSQDSVHVEGYHIVKYKSDEILDIMKNDILRKQGKSHKIFIDFFSQDFYFPLKANHKKLVNEIDIATFVNTNSLDTNIEFFVFPRYQSQWLTIYPFLKDIQTNVSFLPSKQNNYFILNNDTNYVYNIYKIDGNAIRCVFDNDFFYENKNYFYGIAPGFKNFRLPAFFIYFFYDGTLAKCEKPLPGFSVWEHNLHE